MQAGVVNNPIERSAAKGTPGSGVTPVHDLNVPYEGTEEYETPTAEILFPPVSFCCVFFFYVCNQNLRLNKLHYIVDVGSLEY